MTVLTGSSDGQIDGIPLADGRANPDWGTVKLDVPFQYPPLKRALDIVVALTLLVLLAPLLVIVAAIIALDSRGPILFRQTRVGRYGRPFAMLKFRTMRAERRRSTQELPFELTERRQRHKSAVDPRVTRIGRFLRRSCLDELPQLWNVLRGEMSLVGPRPELPDIVDHYEPWQHARHAVAPGITGWWQVNRTAHELMHEATELDIYYVENHSLLLDLRILARTLGAVIDGRGAY